MIVSPRGRARTGRSRPPRRGPCGPRLPKASPVTSATDVTVADLVLLGLAIGASAVVTWHLCRAFGWLFLALYYARRPDVRAGMRRTWSFLRGLGRSRLVTSWDVLNYARQSYFRRNVPQ